MKRILKVKCLRCKKEFGEVYKFSWWDKWWLLPKYRRYRRDEIFLHQEYLCEKCSRSIGYQVLTGGKSNGSKN